MKYEDFAECIKTGVEQRVKENFEDGIVVIRNVLKNNSVRRKAISIVRKSERATPTIYLDEFYKEYKCGRSSESICREIFQTYEESLDEFYRNMDVENFSDFEKVKGRIHYKLIHYEKNRTLLSEIPHFIFLDLAIVFFVSISEDEGEIASILIHNHHIESWNKTAEEIREYAVRNTLAHYPAQIRNMEEIISEMIFDDLKEDWNNQGPDFIAEDCNYGGYNYEQVRSIISEEVKALKAEQDMMMYVLTNNQHLNGAACITYPGVLKNFAKEHQSDIYIIPSSVHEVILIPFGAWDTDWINSVICQVNKEDLDPVDILSDHVYLYSLEEEKILNPAERDLG